MDTIIPFGGGTTRRIELTSLINWVEQQDQIPLTLALSVYTEPYQELMGYKLVFRQTRFCIWINPSTGVIIVGCRGTSIGKAGGKLDLQDDKVSNLLVC
jgi:hypothetical protein